MRYGDADGGRAPPLAVAAGGNRLVAVMMKEGGG
jgi:hypothetical protein